MCRVDKYGFPRTRSKQGRKHFGFQTGDIVKAVVTSGTKIGTYVGRVAVRKRGAFNITSQMGKVTDIHHRFCELLHQSDGYSYTEGGMRYSPPR